MLFYVIKETLFVVAVACDLLGDYRHPPLVPN
jgi:hypothetical protein